MFISALKMCKQVGILFKLVLPVEELDLRKKRPVQPTILTKSDYIFCSSVFIVCPLNHFSSLQKSVRMLVNLLHIRADVNKIKAQQCNECVTLHNYNPNVHNIINWIRVHHSAHQNVNTSKKSTSHWCTNISELLLKKSVHSSKGVTKNITYDNYILIYTCYSCFSISKITIPSSTQNTGHYIPYMGSATQG